MYFSLFVRILCLVFVLVCITLCPFEICNHLYEEERVGCSALLFFLMSCYVNVLWLFFAVLWVSLQYVIEVFSDHTHLLFGVTTLALP